MFTFLVTQSLKNRFLVLALAAVLVIYGAFTLTRLIMSWWVRWKRPQRLQIA